MSRYKYDLYYKYRTCIKTQKSNNAQEISLKIINVFADKITDQHDFILPILIMYKDCTIIVNSYQNYYMMQSIMIIKCKLPTKYGQGYLD